MDPATLALLLATLRLSTPLAIAALGELVAERSGVLNIGIEGMMLCGALAAWSVAAATGSPLLGTFAGLVAGSLAAALFAFFVLGRGADPIVCGTALNILALGLTGSAFRVLYPPSVDLPQAPLAAEWFGVNAFLLLAVAAVPAVAVFLARTRAGLSVRAAGESAEAAHAQGLDVLRIRWLCTIAGGGFAGVAGASLVLWISDTFVEGLTSGRGFIALALVLFGGFRPSRIVLGALLFGAANAAQFRLQAMGLAIPYNLLLMTPYLLTLAVLALFAGRVRAPADLARPFTTRD